jgi:ABC-2 type transport system permease protein
MDIGRALAITRKDLKEVFSSASIYGPMLGIPMFFAIALPVLTLYVAINAAPAIASQLANIPLPSGPPSFVTSVAFTYFFAVNVLGPIFLTMPVFTASVIAADSLVGEKERKTSEALLSMPVSTNELLVGKILSSFIPAELLTIAVFLIYGTVVNLLSYHSLGVYVLPSAAWLMMLLASPFLALAPIAIVVFVSSHVKGIKEAQQISTLLVFPILGMPFTTVLGFTRLTVGFLSAFIVGLIILDIVIIYVGIKTFRRDTLL